MLNSHFRKIKILQSEKVLRVSSILYEQEVKDVH